MRPCRVVRQDREGQQLTPFLPTSKRMQLSLGFSFHPLLRSVRQRRVSSRLFTVLPFQAKRKGYVSFCKNGFGWKTAQTACLARKTWAPPGASHAELIPSLLSVTLRKRPKAGAMADNKTKPNK